jgi:hypothetical protein
MAFNDPRNAASLLTRDFYFKDNGNRPIAANRVLAARGDGGTYWLDGSISTQTAFTSFRASSIQYSASNVNNTIWIEPGTGITFYSTIESGKPVTWIASQGPQTLNVVGQSSIDLLNLPDTVDGGKTLTLQGSGDVQLYVSDATVTFEANNASTFSSITGLQETNENILSTTQSVENQLSNLTNTVDTLLISSSVSTFWSTLIYTKHIAEDLSTFTYSTFQVSNEVLNITYPKVFISSLKYNELDGPFRSTFSTIFWSSASGLNTRTSNLYLSTINGITSPIITFDNVFNRIGINLGQTPPRATVDVSGIVFANNFVTSSDRRLKTAVEPLFANSLPEAYRFTWIRDGTTDIGCMADEVETIAPECVTVGGDGYKAVNYAKLVPYCFSVIKELRARVEALESRH